MQVLIAFCMMFFYLKTSVFSGSLERAHVEQIMLRVKNIATYQACLQFFYMGDLDLAFGL